MARKKNSSGIDFTTLAPKSNNGDVLEVLEVVPAGVIAKDGTGKFRTLQALATNVHRGSQGEFSVRMVSGKPHVVRLRRPEVSREELKSDATAPTVKGDEPGPAEGEAV